MSHVAGKSQAEVLAQNIESSIPERQTGPNDPHVIFRSPLELSREQEERLMAHCSDRLIKLTTELGRDIFAQGEANVEWATLPDIDRQMRKFMSKQHFAHLMYHGHVEWREALKDTIYSETNLHVPLSKRIVMQQVAKAIDSITGTEPWWGTFEVGNQDEKKALDVQRYLQYEFHSRNNLTADINAALELAFIQGQQVGKISYERNVDYYETVANVAVDQSGSPIIASDGEYIYTHDEFIQIETPLGQAEVLKRDKQTPKPPVGADGQIFFQLTKLQKRLDKGSTASFGAIHYLDFLCPLDAESIDKADFVAHLYDKSVINLAHQYLQSDFHALSPELQIERMRDVAKLIKGCMMSANSATSHIRSELNEGSQTLGSDNIEPKLRIAECWVNYDVDGDGIQENLIVVMDESGEIPIYYDYAANMTPDGMRPFRSIVINKVAGRWHGLGQMEVYERLQEAADLMINRWNLSQCKSGRLDVVNPHLTVEGQNDPKLNINYGNSYTAANSNVTAEQVISSVYLRDIKSSDLQQLLQFLLQIAMNMSGVANANDSRMAGLDTAKLATGIMHLEKSGNELFGKFIQELLPAIKDIVKSLAKVVLSNVESDRVYTFFEEEKSYVQTLSKEAVKDIEIDVRIDLTKIKGEQDLARFRQAYEILSDYFAKPFMIQQKLQPVVIRLLKAMQIKNVEDMTEPVDPQQLAQSSEIIPPSPI